MNCELCGLGTPLWRIRPTRYGMHCDVCRELIDEDKLEQKLARHEQRSGGLEPYEPPSRGQSLRMVWHAQQANKLRYKLLCRRLCYVAEEPTPELLNEIARVRRGPAFMRSVDPMDDQVHVGRRMMERVFQGYARGLLSRDRLGEAEARQAQAVWTAISARETLDFDLAEPDPGLRVHLKDSEKLWVRMCAALLRAERVEDTQTAGVDAKVPLEFLTFGAGAHRKITAESLGSLQVYARGTLVITDLRLMLVSHEHLVLPHSTLTATLSGLDRFAVYHEGPPPTACAFEVLGTSKIAAALCEGASRLLGRSDGAAHGVSA